MITIILGAGLINLKNSSFDKKLISDKVMEQIKDENPKRIFNSYYLGGYLINNDIKVFIDGRAEIYSNNILPETYYMQFYEEEFTKYQEEYNFDMIVIKKDENMNEFIINSNKYELINSDEFVNLYKQK